jgi:hypothetical protein
VIRARGYSHVPFPLLFPISCLPFQPSSRLRILVPLPFLSHALLTPPPRAPSDELMVVSSEELCRSACQWRMRARGRDGHD